MPPSHLIPRIYSLSLQFPKQTRSPLVILGVRISISPSVFSDKPPYLVSIYSHLPFIPPAPFERKQRRRRRRRRRRRQKMIKFFKSWLWFSDSTRRPHHSPRDGLGLLVADDFQKPPNVLTSPAVKPAEKPPDAANSSALPCCYNSGGGCCHGLRCCTESLGFESSDEIGAGAKSTVELARSRSWRGRKKAVAAQPKELNFPPPLPSLNRKGQRSSYLRAVRKDGRILITEVRMAERPETLRVCREDGRLRLDLVRPRKEAEEKEDEQDDEVKEETTEAEEETVRQRTFPLTGGDGFRRCHEMRSRQHLHFWNARCVTAT